MQGQNGWWKLGYNVANAEKSLIICPRCQQRAIRTQNSGDFEHDCFGSDVLGNEDILVIGTWSDYTGSQVNFVNGMMQGTENKLQGTRADIEGDKLAPTRTPRGFPTNRYRTRRHIEHIDTSYFNQKQSGDSDPSEYTKDS